MNSNLGACLHSAVVSGNLHLVCTHIDCGAPVNALNDQNETPLHIAVEKGREDIVRLLLEKGARSLPDKSNFEPLLLACFTQSLTIVELLLNAKTQSELSNPQSLFIALLTAVEKSNEQMVSLLLRAGANPNDFLEFPFQHHRLPFSVSCGSFPLHLASHQGHLGIVKLLLKHKANKNCSRIADSYKPLHLAAENDHAEVASHLLMNGVNPNVKTNNDVTALHLAVKAGCVKVVQVLLNCGASLDLKTSNGLTPLLSAVKHHQEAVVKILLERGACVNDEDGNHKTPLLYAIEERNSSLVNCILQYKPNISDLVKELVRRIVLYDENYSVIIDSLIEYGVTLEQKVARNFPLLLNVVKKGYTKLVKYLLASEVDLNDERLDSLLLPAAVQNGNDEIVKLLLKAGCDANAKDEHGNKPVCYVLSHVNRSKHLEILKLLLSGGANIKEVCALLHKAVARGSIELCRFLIEIGADVNALDEKGKGPLHHTAPEPENDFVYSWDFKKRFKEEVDDAKRAEVARLLLENGANVNATTDDGWTPLHFAVKTRHLEVVEALLEFKANVNVVDGSFSMPLHIAAKKGSKNIAKSLLEYGAEVDAPLGEGALRPIHIAAFNGHVEIVKLLLQFDANINAQDAGGNTPLHCAIRRNRAEVVTVLLKNDCDMNIRGNAGNTALSLVLKHFVDSDSDFPNLYKDYEVSNWGREHAYGSMIIPNRLVSAVRDHVTKLRTAGLFVSKWNENLIEQAYKVNDEKLQPFIRECKEEIERMKKMKLCSHITIYSVFVNPVNPAFARNISAIRSLECTDLSEFPIYGSLLVHRSKFNLGVNKLLSVGKKWLIILFKTRNVLNEEKLPTLPVELLEEIVLCLNKTDLKCLISCGETLKRQVSK